MGRVMQMGKSCTLVALVLTAGWGWAQQPLLEASLGSMSTFLGGLRLDLTPLNDLLAPAGYPTLSGWQLCWGMADLTPHEGGFLTGTLSLTGFSEARAADRKTAVELAFFGLLGGTELDEGTTKIGLFLALGGGYLQFTLRVRHADDVADALTPTLSRPLLLFLGVFPFAALSRGITPWLQLELGLGWLGSLPGWWLDDWRALTGPRLAPGGPLLAVGVAFDWDVMISESLPAGPP